MSVGAVRVLLLTHSYSPEVSPPQRRWDSFVYVMRQAGWKVQVVTPRAESRHAQVLSKGRLGAVEVGAHGEIIRSFVSLNV